MRKEVTIEIDENPEYGWTFLLFEDGELYASCTAATYSGVLDTAYAYARGLADN